MSVEQNMLNSLPTYLTNHPFFKTIKSNMSERTLNFKEKMDIYSTLDKKEQFSICSELLDLGFSWPAPLRQEGFWCTKEEKDTLFKEFPFPEENQMEKEEIDKFLAKLEQVEKKTPTFRYMGHSHCRICNEKVGTQTYYTDLFAWPEGYKHYITLKNME